MSRILLLLSRTSYRADDFLDAAGRLGAEVIVGSDHRSTLDALAPGSTFYVDFADPERSLRRILDLAAERPLSAVVAAEDDGVGLAAAAAAELALPHNPPEAVRAAGRKDRMREALASAGVAVPEFRLVPIDADPDRVAGDVAYPCVLKPLFLSASRGVIRADSPAEFAAAFRRIAGILSDPRLVRRGGDAARKILIERYIPGLEVAVEGILYDGDVEILALLDKPDPLEGPFFEETIYVTPCRLPTTIQKATIDTVARTAAALGLREGPVHAEVRVDDAGRIWPIEVAPRSIGGLCSRVLRFGAGLSLEDVILLHATGRRPASLEREPTAAGVMMIPIPRAGVLRGTRGLERARSVRGVDDVVISIPTGETVVPLPEGHRYLGFIFGRGERPEDVELSLREAHRRLDIVIEPAEGSPARAPGGAIGSPAAKHATGEPNGAPAADDGDTGTRSA